MSVAASVRKLLHHKDTDALTPTGAVGGVGVGLAAAVHGQPTLAGELDERAGGGHDGSAAGEREVALPRPQRLNGQVQGDQRGGAGRVHGDRGPFEAQHVGHPTRGHTARIAGADVAFHLFDGTSPVL